MSPGSDKPALLRRIPDGHRALPLWTSTSGAPLKSQTQIEYALMMGIMHGDATYSCVSLCNSATVPERWDRLWRWWTPWAFVCLISNWRWSSTCTVRWYCWSSISAWNKRLSDALWREGGRFIPGVRVVQFGQGGCGNDVVLIDIVSVLNVLGKEDVSMPDDDGLNVLCHDVQVEPPEVLPVEQPLHGPGRQSEWWIEKASVVRVSMGVHTSRAGQRKRGFQDAFGRM